MLKTNGSRILALLVATLLFVTFLPAVTIQSGGSGPSNVAMVDGTANALRIIPYDSRGNMAGQKATYSASTTLKTATAVGTAPWFSICGSATKTVRVQRFLATVTVATAAVYADVELIKTSTATSAGTPVALTKVPHDSTSAAGTVGLVNFYTALATAGSAVGAVASQQTFAPITGTPAVNIIPVDFDYRGELEAEAPVLRGTTQCIEASFGTTTTNAPTIAASVVWTEE